MPDRTIAGSADEPFVHLNDQRLPWQPGLSVAALLQAHGIDASAVATAVNGGFVPRAARAAHLVQPGDLVAVLKPIVGG